MSFSSVFGQTTGRILGENLASTSSESLAGMLGKTLAGILGFLWQKFWEKSERAFGWDQFFGRISGWNFGRNSGRNFGRNFGRNCGRNFAGILPEFSVLL